ncbi:hypothetical protein SMICM304S_07027 [Streptomyces microflavus]
MLRIHFTDADLARTRIATAPDPVWEIAVSLHRLQSRKGRWRTGFRVGAGFAGVECVRRLERRLAPGEAEIALVTPFSYQLYLPLLPQVASVFSPPSRSRSPCAAAAATAPGSSPAERSAWTRRRRSASSGRSRMRS